MVDLNNLVRDPKRVKATLVEEGDQLITKTGCKIYIPTRWTEKNLAVVGQETRSVAIFPIVIEDKYYSTSLVAAPMPLKPSRTSIVKFGDEPYYEFTFTKGSVVCSNLNLVKVSTLSYYIYDEFIAKAHVPWFMNYVDLLKVLASAEAAANIKLAANNVPLELLVATIARSNKDITKYYRHNAGSLDSVITNPPDYVPLGSVLHGATNTTAKLMGNYLDDGITSALNNPTSQVDTVETLFRL